MDWVLLGVAAVVALVAAALILMLTAPSGAEVPAARPADSVDDAGEHTDASGT